MTTTYHVTGMTCDHCVHAVTEELNKVDGVESVSVNLEEGTVAIAGTPTKADVQAAIEEAGYALKES